MKEDRRRVSISAIVARDHVDPHVCTDWFDDGCNYCGVH
jgi:hypothetical protein